MDAVDFFKAVVQADFHSLIEKNLDEFHEFVSRKEREGATRAVIRFMMETDENDGIPRPFYLWATYPMVASGSSELAIFPPDFSNPATYLDIPDELRDEEFFEIAIGRA